ncbi:cupin domain-containing protein [Candidatus Protofrankia californiensis]|uniref:cupin domain-containing protein n=1 Tax=Candidatus Protofrankia californiensis TaxID=1839754 RepID=UPI001040ED6F|nr:cupin domain-containing protein [Candidatus Protofrankia californiensis]
MSIHIKRVVTGVDQSGKSVVYEDAELPAVTVAMMPGAGFFGVWGTEGELSSPVASPQPDNKTFFPAAAGTRFGLLRFPPESKADADLPTPDEETLTLLVTEAETKLPGLIGVFEPDAPGMHQTKTIDYCMVLEGELHLELDDGAEVHLPAGSCIVQNGARHAWHNRGDVPATLAYVIISPREQDTDSPSLPASASGSSAATNLSHTSSTTAASTSRR